MKKAGTLLLTLCMAMMLALTGCGEPDGSSPDAPPADNGGMDGGGMDGGGGLDDGGLGGDGDAPMPE